jgi:hypothetical protein
MKRLIAALLLLVAFASAVYAADNLFGLEQVGQNVRAKNGLLLKASVATGNASLTNDSFVQLNRASNATMTVTFTPVVGQFFVVSQVDSHVATATVSLPTGWTWNGSNKSATFNAQHETLIGFCTVANRVIIVENIGSVGFTD